MGFEENKLTGQVSHEVCVLRQLSLSSFGLIVVEIHHKFPAHAVPFVVHQKAANTNQMHCPAQHRCEKAGRLFTLQNLSA